MVPPGPVLHPDLSEPTGLQLTPPPPPFMELRRDEKTTGDPRCPPHPPVSIRQNVVLDGGDWGYRTRPSSSTSLPSSTVSPQQLSSHLCVGTEEGSSSAQLDTVPAAAQLLVSGVFICVT